jgi:hypothetical protein
MFRTIALFLADSSLGDWSKLMSKDRLSESEGVCEDLPLASQAWAIPRDRFVPSVNQMISEGALTGCEFVVLSDSTIRLEDGWEEILGLLGGDVIAVSGPESYAEMSSSFVAMRSADLEKFGLCPDLSVFGWEIALAADIRAAGKSYVTADFDEFFGDYVNSGRDDTIGALYYSMIEDMNNASAYEESVSG